MTPDRALGERILGQFGYSSACSCSPSPPLAGGEGWGEGAAITLLTLPSPPANGGRGSEKGVQAYSKVALAVALAAALAGCSNLAPYPTVPPALPPGKTAAGARVAICYDGFAGSRAAARARAQRECPAKTAAVYLATDWRLNHCPLLQPARATFRCISGK